MKRGFDWLKLEVGAVRVEPQPLFPVHFVGPFEELLTTGFVAKLRTRGHVVVVGEVHTDLTKVPSGS